MITSKRMNTYYTGKHASRYNRTWRTALQKTLLATHSAIDVEAVQQRASRRERPLRIVDAACGTGLLLEQFTHLFPHAELYGIDESQAMLAQATQLLQDRPDVHLAQVSLGGGETRIASRKSFFGRCNYFFSSPSVMVFPPRVPRRL